MTNFLDRKICINRVSNRNILFKKSKMRAQSSILLFLALCFFRGSHAAGNNTWDLSEEDGRELERELEALNKPYVKSFKVTATCSHLSPVYTFIMPRF